MKKNVVSWDPSQKDGYIPAPYVLEEGEKINDLYLEPALLSLTKKGRTPVRPFCYFWVFIWWRVSRISVRRVRIWRMW